MIHTSPSLFLSPPQVQIAPSPLANKSIQPMPAALFSAGGKISLRVKYGFRVPMADAPECIKPKPAANTNNRFAIFK
jgi:hypothetical protein